MSDALDIRSGGAVAVDTDSLVRAAAGFEIMADELDDLTRRVGLVAAVAGGDPVSGSAHPAIALLGERVAASAGHARDSAAGLRAAAAVYEHAELTALWAAASAAGDTDAMARLDARRTALEAAFPAAAGTAGAFAADHDARWRAALIEDALGANGPAGSVGMLWGAGLGALGLAALLAGLSAWGAGTVPADARLGGRPASGAPPAVRVTATTPGAAVAPPRGVADIVARVPTGGAAQVRVERYAMPDGSRHFVVYVAGTRGGSDAAQPWDNVSNAQLYTGRSSASLEATVQALHASGARPGDVVHAVGHSQGAMIASRLAMEGDFDTRTLVSIGSPVAADVGPSTLSLELRHAEDPVGALAVGGHPHPVGAPGSLVVERPAGQGPGLSLDAHGLDTYTATGAMLDRDADPRLAATRRLFDELSTAESVTAVEYIGARVSPVERVSPGASGAG